MWGPDTEACQWSRKPWQLGFQMLRNKLPAWCLIWLGKVGNGADVDGWGDQFAIEDVLKGKSAHANGQLACAHLGTNTWAPPSYSRQCRWSEWAAFVYYVMFSCHSRGRSVTSPRSAKLLSTQIMFIGGTSRDFTAVAVKWAIKIDTITKVLVHYS